tara:strand:- start:991 stop:1155 length:165 start_codon:yes stop_codon:yes gene_type:complete
MLDNGSMKCYDQDGNYDEAATIEAILTQVKTVIPDRAGGVPIRVVSIGDQERWG